MASATILIKYPSKLADGFERLGKLAQDAQFICQSRCIIESVNYSFGSSDFTVQVFAMTWGDIAVAVNSIRTRLDGDAGQTLTSTILGLGSESCSDPHQSVHTRLDDILGAGRRADALGMDHGGAANRVAIAVLAKQYLRERLSQMAVVVDAASSDNSFVLLSSQERREICAALLSLAKTIEEAPAQFDPPS